MILPVVVDSWEAGSRQPQYFYLFVQLIYFFNEANLSQQHWLTLHLRTVQPTQSVSWTTKSAGLYLCVAPCPSSFLSFLVAKPAGPCTNSIPLLCSSTSLSFGSWACASTWFNSLLLPHLPSYCIIPPWLSLLFFNSKCLTFASRIISLLSEEPPLAIFLEKSVGYIWILLVFLHLRLPLLYLNFWNRFSLGTEF